MIHPVCPPSFVLQEDLVECETMPDEGGDLSNSGDADATEDPRLRDKRMLEVY